MAEGNDSGSISHRDSKGAHTMAEGNDSGSISHRGSGYGLFKIKAAEIITRAHAEKLAIFWNFSPRDIEIIGRATDPGLTLIMKMEEMDIISESNIDKLINALEKINLKGPASKLREEYSKIHDKTSLKHEMYPHLTKMQFKTHSQKGKGVLDMYNCLSKEEYKIRIANYSLEHDHGLQCSDNANETRHIAIMGKTGDGKSSTANTILGRDVFLTSESSQSTTKSSSDAECTYKKRMLTVVDTPGVHDTVQDKVAVIQELARVAFLLRRGVHCFIICMSAGDSRFTQETIEMLETIQPDDPDNFFNYCMLVYTKPETELNKTSLDDFLNKKKENEENKRLLESIQDRVVAVNNKSDMPAEIQRNREVIIAMVDKLVAENKQRSGHEIYTNELFKIADGLHKKVVTTVAEYKCHPSLVNATIEALISISSTEMQLDLDIFVEEVITILQKSETCEMNDIKGLVFTNDGNITIVPRDTYTEQIKRIYNGTNQDAIRYFDMIKSIPLHRFIWWAITINRYFPSVVLEVSGCMDVLRNIYRLQEEYHKIE